MLFVPVMCSVTGNGKSRSGRPASCLHSLHLCHCDRSFSVCVCVRACVRACACVRVRSCACTHINLDYYANITNCAVPLLTRSSVQLNHITCNIKRLWDSSVPHKFLAEDPGREIVRKHKCLLCLFLPVELPGKRSVNFQSIYINKVWLADSHVIRSCHVLGYWK